MENFVNEVTTFFWEKFVYNNNIQYEQNLSKNNKRVVLDLYIYSSHNSPTFRRKAHFTSETHFIHSLKIMRNHFFPSSETKLQEQYSNFFF